MSTTEFYELAIRCLSGEGSKEDREKLEQFLQNKEYRQLYQKLSTSFLPDHDSSPLYNPERSLERLRDQISKTEKFKGRQSRKPGSILRNLVAASVAVLIAMGIGLKFYGGKDEPKASATEIVWLEKSAPAGQQLHIVLADGTDIVLNGNSKLRYASDYSTQAVRKVFLSGEAFFSVKHNDSQKFEVVTGHVVTRDLGTRFNIEAYAEDSVVRVALVDGAIEVNSPVAKHVQLQPSQQLTYHANENRQEVSAFNVEEMTGWKDQLLIFHNKPLSQVLERISRFYGKTIICQDNSLKNIVLTTQFKQKSLPQVLEVLSYAVDVRFVDKGDTILAVKDDGLKNSREN